MEYKGSKWRLGRSERSRDNYRINRELPSQSNIPRKVETYRADRRNHSILNRDKKNWYGVEAKLRPEPPPLIITMSSAKAKHPGETHYTTLWV